MVVAITLIQIIKMYKLKILIGIAALVTTQLFSIPAGAQNSKDSSDSSAKQRQELMRDYGISEPQAMYVQRFSFVRSKQIDSLVKLNLPMEDLRIARDKVTDEYYMKIYNILTPEQQALFDMETYKAARTGEVQNLKLSPKQALAMGKIKVEYTKSVTALNEQSLPAREKKSAKNELDRKYRNDLKVLLGNTKFAEWQQYKDTEHVRRFKQNFGFTDEQYKKFVDLENAQAVTLLKIKNSAMPFDEKEREIAAAKNIKVEALREILSAESFDKWYEYYLRKERKHNEK